MLTASGGRDAEDARASRGSGCDISRRPDAFAWLTGYRRLTIRYERSARLFTAFLTLAATLTGYKKLYGCSSTVRSRFGPLSGHTQGRSVRASRSGSRRRSVPRG
jgi:hypothetical protein